MDANHLSSKQNSERLYYINLNMLEQKTGHIFAFERILVVMRRLDWKVSKSYLQEDGVRDNCGFLIEMKDSIYQQNQDCLRERGGHLTWILHTTTMDPGLMSKGSCSKSSVRAI